MIKIRNKDFDVVSISKNLAGVRKYAAMYGVERIDIYPDKKTLGCQLGICFKDGASTIHDWRSYTICLERMKKWKHFKDVTPTIHA